MLESRGHDRPLEFGTVYLTLRGDNTDALRNILYTQKIPGLKYINKLLEPNMILTYMLY